MTPQKNLPQRLRDAAYEIGVTLPPSDHEDYERDLGEALLRYKTASDELHVNLAEVRRVAAQRAEEIDRINAERVNLINEISKNTRDAEGAAEELKSYDIELNQAKRNLVEWQAEATKHREASVELNKQLHTAVTECDRLRQQVASLRPPTSSITLDSPGSSVVKVWRRDQTVSIEVTAEDPMLRACVAAVFREAVTLP